MSSKSNASTKILGFKYQEMVALKECFEAKDGKKLIDTHIDFWKTLSNMIHSVFLTNLYCALQQK